MGVMNRFKDMFKGEDEYDVDGYNDGYDSYDDVADEGGVNESVQAQPQPAARDMRSNGGVLSASALEMKVIKPDRFEAVRLPSICSRTRPSSSIWRRRTRRPSAASSIL